MMHKMTIGVSVATLAILFATPAPAPHGCSSCYSKQGSTAATGLPTGKRAMTTAQEPPDPCLKFKLRRVREQCVTRQMNLSAVHGSAPNRGTAGTQ